MSTRHYFESCKFQSYAQVMYHKSSFVYGWPISILDCANITIYRQYHRYWLHLRLRFEKEWWRWSMGYSVSDNPVQFIMKKEFLNDFLTINVVVSIGHFCCVVIGTRLWLLTVRRQTSRMNILLFRSLLQRVSWTYFFLFSKIRFLHIHSCNTIWKETSGSSGWCRSKK